MKVKLVAFLALSFVLTAGIVFADVVNGGVAGTHQNGPDTLFRLAIVALPIILGIYGVYRSRKKTIVIFANYTDFLVTASIPLSVFLFYELFGKPGSNEPLRLCFALFPGFCIFLVVCWATYLYNKSVNSGIFGFLLALYTNIFLFAAYCLLVFGSFFNKRKKGETRASFERRDKASTAFIAGLLTYLGISDTRFVSLREYLSGKWGDTHE